jgi:hypothetical protein
MSTPLLNMTQSNVGQPEPLYFDGLGAVAPRKLTICSVHFEPKTERFMHSRRRTFFMPAAKKGSYSLLDVYDSQQAVRNTSDPEADSASFIAMPVPVETIANSLVSSWAGSFIGVMGRNRPGIDRIEGDKPTDKELARLNKWEEALCRAAVEEADKIEKGTQKGIITDFHRKALEWLDSEKRTWYRPIELGHTKVSVVSGNRIPMAALADNGEDLIEYYVKYDLEPLDFEDAHINKMLTNDLRRKVQHRLGLNQQVK